MPLKSSLLLSVVMLGASTIILHSQGIDVTPMPAASKPLFSAPPALPADAADLSTPGLPAASGEINAPSPQPVVARAGTPAPWIVAKPKPPASVPTDGAADASDTIDMSALRYYAHQNDVARVAAEIRLLRAKHPGWEPPEDLFAEVKGGESEQPLWDLFAKHDMDGLNAAIEERRQRTPGWQPSNDLARKVGLTTAYNALIAASDSKQWGSVIDMASSTPTLMTCGTVDAIWRTAEALVHSDDEAHAVEAYRYVLSTCSKPGERLATVQKASVLLKAPESLASLLQMGRRLPSGKSEFEQVRLDLLRQKVGEASAGTAGATPTQAELDALAASAHATDGRSDAELLGWYSYSHKDFPAAETWFRTALQSGVYPKGAEGLVLTLRSGGKLPEAQALALQYAGLDHLNRKLMVEVLSAGLSDANATPLSTDQIVALAAAIDAEKSAEGAQSYGWFRYKSGDIAGSQGWFQKSAEWQSNESAAIGLVVTANRLKQKTEFAALVNQYRGIYPRVAELERLMKSAPVQAHSVAHATRVAGVVHRGQGGPSSGGGWDQGATAIVKTFDSGNYEQAMAMLDQRKAEHHSEPNGLSVVRGWAMYKKGDWEGAKQLFSDLGSKGMTRESEEGLREINLGYSGPRYR